MGTAYSHLRHYVDLCDRCEAEDLILRLIARDFKHGRSWKLEVRRGKAVVAKCGSTLLAPMAFDKMAQTCMGLLDQGQRLK